MQGHLPRRTWAYCSLHDIMNSALRFAWSNSLDLFFRIPCQEQTFFMDLDCKYYTYIYTYTCICIHTCVYIYNSSMPGFWGSLRMVTASHCWKSTIQCLTHFLHILQESRQGHLTKNVWNTHHLQKGNHTLTHLIQACQLLPGRKLAKRLKESASDSGTVHVLTSMEKEPLHLWSDVLTLEADWEWTVRQRFLAHRFPSP